MATDYQLTLLLDGLDEVQAEHREACVAAINDLRAEQLVDIVITSRTADYEDLHMQLNISTAVLLRPLTLEQIETYLTAGGESLAALRHMLQEDAYSQALAQTPLLLSMMAMTYRNQSVGVSQDNSSPVEQRRRLFNHYVQYMFAHQRLTSTQIQENRRRLSWLSQHMALRAQSAFSPDILQKTWLPSKTAQYSFIILVGILYWLITALIIGIVFSSFKLGVVIGILLGTVGINTAHNSGINKAGFRERFRRIDIPLKSYRLLLHAFAIGMGIGIVGLLNTTLIWCITIGTVTGIVYWLIHSRKDVRFFLLQGINRRNLPRIFTYIMLPIFVGVWVGLVGYDIGSQAWNPTQTILMGILLSLMLWMVLQLLVILIVLAAYTDSHIQHYLLRALLMLSNILPWQSPHFLDEMVACGFLRRSGKSYLFVHSLLRDHFASSAQEFGVFSTELSRFDLDVLWKTAKIHREQGQFEQALLCVNRAIRLQPKGVSLFQERGHIYWEMEEYSLALADFNRAIELQPKVARLFQTGDWLFQSRGYTHLEMEEYSLALADFNRAIELQPKVAWFFRDRGITYREMEEYSLALADFNRAIELQPKEARFFGERGITYREIKEYQLALVDFNCAIELQPKEARFFGERGITYREIKEYQLALVDFNRAVELQPNLAWLFEDRGITYREIKEYQLALADFNRAIELQPKWPRLFRERGITYLLRSNIEKAATDFQEAIVLFKQHYEKYPGNWGKSLLLAFYYLVANHEIEARQIYQSGHEAPVHFIKRAIRRLDEFQAIFPDHTLAQAMRQLLQEYLRDMDR